MPLGALVGARSGDKGGAANVGFWVPELGDGLADLRYSWFESWLTADRVRDLLPEADPLGVDMYRLPNLRAINVVIHGLLGRGSLRQIDSTHRPRASVSNSVPA